MQKRPTVTKLKAGRAFWHNGTDKEKNIVRLLNTPVEEMTQEEMVVVMKELDRRFLQLWDKVVYERDDTSARDCERG